jgi:hypothetical protein
MLWMLHPRVKYEVVQHHESQDVSLLAWIVGEGAAMIMIMEPENIFEIDDVKSLGGPSF